MSSDRADPNDDELTDSEGLRLAASELAESESLQASVLDAVRKKAPADLGERELRELLKGSLSLRGAANDLRAAVRDGDDDKLRQAVGDFTTAFLRTAASRPIGELGAGDGAIAGIPTTMGDPDYLPHPRA